MPVGRVWHEVIEANDGKEALSIYQEHQPDAVLLDFVMPDEDAPMTPVVGIRHDQADDVVRRIVHAGELDDLAARVAIEREASTGIHHVASCVAVSAEYEAPIL